MRHRKLISTPTPAAVLHHNQNFVLHHNQNVLIQAKFNTARDVIHKQTLKGEAGRWSSRKSFGSKNRQKLMKTDNILKS